MTLQPAPPPTLDGGEISAPMDPGDTAMPEAVLSGIVLGRNEETRFLKSLRRIIRALGNYSRQLTQQHGITSPQLICLLRLKEIGPMSMKALAAAVDLSPSTVVGIVDRLEIRGLVRRERSGLDRRVVTLIVTPKGEELLETAPSPLQDALVEALRLLPAEESARLAETLEQIVDLMEIRKDVPDPLDDLNIMA